MFGGLAGAGIFTAQYFGQKDHEGVRQTFRYKFWMAVILTVATVVVFLTSGDSLIRIYLQGEGSAAEITATLNYGKQYLYIMLIGLPPFMLGQVYSSTLRECGIYLQGEGSAAEITATLNYGKQYLYIMLIGLPPFMLGQVYSSTLRECGETVLPMKAGVTAVLVNLVFNYLLIYGKFGFPQLGVRGAAIAMKAGVTAVLVNLVFNYLLIYGKFGFPQLGVRGAAIATVISRYVEVAIVLIWAAHNKQKFPFIEGLYHTLKVPKNLAWKIFIKGTPLLLNEAMWACGVAILAQCYSVRGLNVVAAQNISNTINNVFNIVFIALGDSVAIVVGQLLGAGDMKKARDTDNKMIAFSVFCCIGVAAVLLILAPLFPLGAGDMKKARDTDNKMIAFSVFCCIGVAAVLLILAPLFPELYNTNPEAKKLACQFIMISALFMPNNAFLHAAYFTLRSGGKTVITFAKKLACQFIMISALFMPNNAFLHAAYFTLRSGGKTVITFLFDSVFMWCVSVSMAFVLSRYTGLSVVAIFALVQAADIIKSIIGFILVKKGVWLQNFVSG